LLTHERPREVSYSLHGEYDLVNAHELAIALRRLCDETSGDVVVDCTGLRFWDSSAIGVMIEIQERLRDARRLLRLTNLHGTPLRALEVLSLAESFGAEPRGLAP